MRKRISLTLLTMLCAAGLGGADRWAQAEAPRASDTTCAAFNKLDPGAQQNLMNQILAENPGNPFTDTPAVAAGAAKLVCNHASAAQESVAKAAGITGHPSAR